MKPTLNDAVMFPSNYLCAEDLRGKDVVVTIHRVYGEDLMMQGGRKAKKFLLQFEGKEKKLVLNRTNATTIAELHGTKAEQWIGKKICLYPTTCRFGPNTVTCIRIRENANAKPE